MLGVMNFKSEGGPKDLAEATRIFRLAAEQGNTKAQVILGSMHYEGKGGPPDFAEARRLLGLAAAQGQAKAQAELGNMHQGPEDLAELGGAAARIRCSTRCTCSTRPSRGAVLARRDALRGQRWADRPR